MPNVHDSGTGNLVVSDALDEFHAVPWSASPDFEVGPSLASPAPSPSPHPLNTALGAGGPAARDRATAETPRRVIGVYAYWALDLTGGWAMAPEDIDTSLVTHVVFAYADLAADGTVSPGGAGDLQGSNASPGLYQRLNVGVKGAVPGLRSLISVGGAGSAPTFATVMAAADGRRVLVGSLVAFCRRHGFDGVSIDW